MHERGKRCAGTLPLTVYMVCLIVSLFRTINSMREYTGRPDPLPIRRWAADSLHRAEYVHTAVDQQNNCLSPVYLAVNIRYIAPGIYLADKPYETRRPSKCRCQGYISCPSYDVSLMRSFVAVSLACLRDLMAINTWYHYVPRTCTWLHRRSVSRWKPSRTM